MSANFNMRMDSHTKEQLSHVLANYGLTVPQAFKLFANQVIKTKQVPLSFDWATDIDYEQNPVTMQAIDDVRKGKVTRFDNADALMQVIKDN